MTVPVQPKIYHITHVENLAQLASNGWLLSDARRLQQNLACRVVGMSTIKRRRLEQNEVSCHPGTKVGQYAPFYFCPRSIMLYILHMGNHPDLDYTEGQRPIVHLQADLAQTIEWANRSGVKWAFSDRNAGGTVVQYFNRWEDLNKVNWPAIEATDFRDAFIKEGKQAEFLLYDTFPWELVEKIGVRDLGIAGQVQAAIARAGHRPSVSVEPGWYY